MKIDQRRGGEISFPWHRLLIFCCLLFLVGCQSTTTTPKGLEVKVTRVVSGQTLEVIEIGKQPKLISRTPDSSTRVRLIGIDAPDLQQQPWGKAAKERLQAMVEGTVLLEFDLQNQDAFGRQLAYVWQAGVLLNEQLVQEGCVLFLPRSPNQKYDQRLERAQEWARLMGQGIWHPSQPMRLTPSEFRRQQD